MEAFMRILVSVMALAIAFVWPSAGAAQSKKSGAHSNAAAQQKLQRPAKKLVTRGAGQAGCAGYAWWGCTGWDPDPNIRAMLARDVGGDD
jgi:hypothetical protein